MDPATNPTVVTTPVASPKAVEPPSATVPSATQRALTLTGFVSLALGVLTLLGCVVVLFVYLGVTLVQAGKVEIPEGTGSKEDSYKDYFKVNVATTKEGYRQAAQIEQRSAVLRSCGLLAGAAIAFIALALFLGAVQARLANPDAALTFGGRFAPLVPSVVALLCATLIIAICAPESRSPVQQSNYPYQSIPPFAVPPYSATPSE